MGWTPSNQQDAHLRLTIKQKFGESLGGQANVYTLLLDANGYRQALAVLQAVSSVRQIEDLQTIGFDKLKNNDSKYLAERIGSAADDANEIKRERQRQQEAERRARDAQQRLNETITGKLDSIDNRYRQHLQDRLEIRAFEAWGQTAQGNPLELINIAQPFRNGERALPAAQGFTYMEWYCVIAGVRSREKRVITASNNQIYYTDGGTHIRQAEWYELVRENWGTLLPKLRGE